MRFSLTAGLVLLLCGTLAPPAGAQPLLDRVQVGAKGARATRGFSPSLAVTLAAPAAYTRGCCYDSVSGQWAGPAWSASADPAAGEPSTIDWGVTFTRGKALQSAARSAWTRFPQASAAKRKVRHVVDGRTVGTLTGYAVIDAQRAPGAEAQGVLAIDLGRRVTALARFALANPPVGQDASFGTVTVGGMPAAEFNRKQAAAAIAAAYVEGVLPPARVKARAAGRQVKGTVTDQFGHPDSTIPVALKSGTRTVAKGTTDSRGGFTLTAPRPGRYQVVASVAGSSARGRVTVR